jgi:hypothetical protein
MYLLLSTFFNRAFLDLLFVALPGLLGDRLNYLDYFVAALLLAGSGIVCGHWARRRSRTRSIRSAALLGLWGGYLTLALVGGFALLVGAILSAMGPD